MDIFGNLGIENAISLQNLITICNIANDWSNANPTEKIRVTILNGEMPNKDIVESFIRQNITSEELLRILSEDVERYYFVFTENIRNARDPQGLKYELPDRKNIRN